MKHIWFYASETLLDALFNIFFLLPYAQKSLVTFGFAVIIGFMSILEAGLNVRHAIIPNIKVRPNKSKREKSGGRKEKFSCCCVQHLMNPKESEWQPKHSHHVAIVRKYYCLHIVRSRKSQEVCCRTTKTFATSFYSDISSSPFFSGDGAQMCDDDCHSMVWYSHHMLFT